MKPPLLDARFVSVMRGEAMVLRDVTIKIRQGEHVAILGPNGCGKTTLIRLLTQELHAYGDPPPRFRLFGKDRWDVFKLRSQLGIVRPDLWARFPADISVFDLVASGAFASFGVWSHHKLTSVVKRTADQLLKTMEIAHLKERSLTDVSAGEAQRALIARALVNRPHTLLLDEPCSNLDPGAQNRLRQTLRRLAKSGLTLIVVTHHIEDLIPEISRVVLMKAGEIVKDGRKDEVLTQENLKGLFGYNARLLKDGKAYFLR